MAVLTKPERETLYREEVQEIDRLLRLYDISRTRVAQAAGVTQSFVSSVLRSRYKSQRVLDTARQVLREMGVNAEKKYRVPKGGRPDGKRAGAKTAA